MKLTDEIRIEAPRQKVYEALNDPEILRQSIPGCDELERLSDTEFAGAVRTKVGPVSARFKGTVTLSDLNPPASYTISGEGKGAASFTRGQAAIQLEEDGGATNLKYDVDVAIGGKLAQLGSRIVEGTAKRLAGEFFENLQGLLGAPAARPQVPVAAAGTGKKTAWIWILAGAVLVAALLYGIFLRG